MDTERPITILSDLHYGFGGSHIASPAQLAPIFAESSLVIFNGDTVEQRAPEYRRRSWPLLDALRCEAARHSCEVRLLSGNHDPAASDTHHLDLCDGAVLVTHGDILFESITPWSPDSEEMGKEYRRLLSELSLDEAGFLERHLLANKQASLMVAYQIPRIPANRLGRLMTVLSQLWPITRPLQILKAWADTPRLAFQTLDRYRPGAQVIVFGHVHFPGIWSDSRSRWAMNTGSFTPPLGAAAVQITSGRTVVFRRVRRSHRKLYHLEKPERIVELRDQPAAATPATLPSARQP